MRNTNVLWVVVNWGECGVMRSNNNAFVFNWMMGYNIEFYNVDDCKWQ